MRLSVVFELLLILLIIAFAASNVIRDPSTFNKARLLKKVEKNAKRRTKETSATPTKYCNCSSSMCNCCRDFNIPVVSSKGPGCASISFLKDNEFGISMKYGDRILRNITITGEKPQPVCMRLPGGVSKFCGRVYNIEKQGEQFKACLGLELRALENLEAALRVSCFRFGPEGVKVEAAEPFPPVFKQKGDKNEEEEEDDDDEYADDDDDDDDFGLSDDDDDDDDDSEDAADNDVDSADYTGFSALSSEFLEGFFGSESSKKKKKPQVKEKPFSHSSMHSVMTHKQENIMQSMQPVAQTMSQRPNQNKVKPTRLASTVNGANPVVATVAKVPPVKVATAAPVRNRVRVKVTPTSTTSTTTTERSTPPPVEPFAFIETTTAQPIVETTENTREEDGNVEMITSTMVSITSMQQMEEEEEDEEEEEEENEKVGGGGGGLSTTTEMTTEPTTETYTERDVTASDRVDELKMENDKELLVSAAKIKDEDDEEEDDDDDEDDDVASVVDVTTLLDDDEDADHFGTNVDGKEPNKKKEEDILSGILDDDDDDDDEEEEEEENKKKTLSQRTISLVGPTSAVRQQQETTVKEVEQPTTMLQPSSVSTTTEEIRVTRPPLAGMRLFVMDPKHPTRNNIEYARSSRSHRRMRLPPLGMESTFS